jgi:hypothetical protein
MRYACIHLIQYLKSNTFSHLVLTPFFLCTIQTPELDTTPAGFRYYSPLRTTVPSRDHRYLASWCDGEPCCVSTPAECEAEEGCNDTGSKCYPDYEEDGPTQGTASITNSASIAGGSSSMGAPLDVRPLCGGITCPSGWTCAGMDCVSPSPLVGVASASASSTGVATNDFASAGIIGDPVGFASALAPSVELPCSPACPDGGVCIDGQCSIGIIAPVGSIIGDPVGFASASASSVELPCSPACPDGGVCIDGQCSIGIIASVGSITGDPVGFASALAPSVELPCSPACLDGGV